MNSGDRYFDPMKTGATEGEVDLYKTLSSEKYDKSTIRLVVKLLEEFIEHRDVVVRGGGNDIVNNRKASQQLPLEGSAFLQEVLIMYDYDARGLVKERYAVTFTIAGNDENLLTSSALITIFNNQEVTMEVSDYNILYIDEEVIVAHDVPMRPACEYDVEKLHDLMVEMMLAQSKKDKQDRRHY